MVLQLGSLDCDSNILDEYSQHNLFDDRELVTYLVMLTLAISLYIGNNDDDDDDDDSDGDDDNLSLIEHIFCARFYIQCSA